MEKIFVMFLTAPIIIFGAICFVIGLVIGKALLNKNTKYDGKLLLIKKNGEPCVNLILESAIAEIISKGYAKFKIDSENNLE